MPEIRLYDLYLDTLGEIWSPNTCKTRFALNVKGIEYETEWLTFAGVHSAIPKVTKTGKKPTVPVIEDLKHGGKAVQESWEIAQYLEEAYPDYPSLFHGNAGVHYFFHNYCTHNILTKVFKLCVLKIHSRITPKELQDWFRQDRETQFKMTLEEFAGDENQHIKVLSHNLGPVGRVLTSYPYLTGDKVGWADVVLAAYFTLFARMRPDLFEQIVLNAPKYGSAFKAWWARMEKYRQDRPPPANARI
ncbi:hypothetical protein VTP01DRAFT_9825 [Rhizomucor pusillus]|uniref:uncharacterized protein n=1 Tax=Rhizomucor pusillus TaxID=4840 RepID=UPI003743A979